MERQPVECEYLLENQTCKAVKEEVVGGRIRGKYCTNTAKDHCCYLCTDRETCEVSCTYLDPPEAAIARPSPSLMNNESKIKKYQEEIGRLAILLAEGKIGEQSYLLSTKTLESKIEELKKAKEDLNSGATSATSSSIRLELESNDLYKRPSLLWYFVPFFFGIIGGLVAYVGTKDEDKAMADGLLLLGIVMSIVWAILYWIIIASTLSRF